MSEITRQPCQGCGNPHWFHSKITFGKHGMREECDRCSSVTFSGNPDVYFRESYLDPNLLDPDSKNPQDWKGTHIHSRQQKADLMKKLGVREAGDRVRGARSDPKPRRIYNV